MLLMLCNVITLKFIISILYNDIWYEVFVFLTQIIAKQTLFCSFQLFDHAGASTHTELCPNKSLVLDHPGLNQPFG